MTMPSPARPDQELDDVPFAGELALARALERVVQLFDECDRLQARGEELPGRLTAQVLGELDRLVYAFDRTARYSLPDRAARIGAHVRAALLPLARGGELGALVERCFLQLPAARAMQHQRELLVREIRSVIASGEGHPVHVTSLAAGPAREIFELYARLDEPRVLVSTLVDFDAAAIHPLELPPQDFIYSIGLIDQLDDVLVIELLDRIHAVLRPGGRVLLGSFHPRNPSRALMDHVLDWKLAHRDEDDLNALFRASAFGTTCSRFVYEPQRIHLLAECAKA